MVYRTILFVFLLAPNFLIGQEEIKIDTTELKENIIVVNELLKKVKLSEAKLNLDLLEKNLKSIKDEYPLLYGSYLHTNGIYNLKISDLKTAKSLFSLALKVRLKHLGENHFDTANTINNLALVFLYNGNYQEAKEYFERSKNIRIKTLGSDHIKIADSYNSLGTCFTTLGNYQRALQCFQKALKIQLRNNEGSKIGLSQTYGNLGGLLLSTGNYIKSIEYFNKSLEIQLKINGPKHPEVGIAYGNLGIAYYEKRDYEAALLYTEKALGLFKENFGEEHPRIAHIFGLLGTIYMSQKNGKKAVEFSQKALDMWIKTTGTNTNHVARAYDNLGASVLLNGNIDRAIELHYQGLENKLKFQGLKHPDLFTSYASLGNIYAESGDYAKSDSFYIKALESLNYKNKWSLSSYSNTPAIINVLANRGTVYLKWFKKNNDINLLHKSKEINEDFDYAIQFQRNWLINKSKRELTLKNLQKYEESITTNLLIYNLSNEKSCLLEAYKFSERNKSLILSEAINNSTAFNNSNIPNDTIKKVSLILSEISSLEIKRQEKLSSGVLETDATILAISSKLFDLNRDYDALKENLEQNYPKYFRVKNDLSTISVNEVQEELLNQNQTLLEYFVGDSSIFIYIINKDDYKVHEIKKNFPLEEWVKTFRKANNEDHYENNISAYCQVAHDLYQKLIAPVAEDLAEELIIIPDGILGYIPFEALLVEPVNKHQRFKAHHYLLKDKQISYSYSATLLKQIQERKHKQKGTNDFLAFAPYYDNDTTLLTSLFRYGEEEDKKPFKPLSNSGPEVYGIQKIIGGDVYYKADATEEKFTSQASNYRIIHLATHARANDKVGDYCYLAFTEQKDSIENELLYVRDLYNLQLNADMVVLSACETGIGELQKGEGIISLARGMTYAGAKSIITSLWSVEDGRTKDIMISFYQHLKNGMAKDAALRQAKLDFINNEKNDHPNVHPLYWSGFIGVGDMSKLF